MVKERYLKVANLNDGVGKKIVEALKKQSTGEVDTPLSQPVQQEEQFNTGLGIDISALDSLQSSDISTSAPVEDFSNKQIPNFDEFFNDEEPLWFSESSHRISPVYQLRTEAGALAQKLKSAGLTQEVVPVLIEKNGTIINAADMGETWKRQGVVVCRTDLGGPEELPSFEQALPKATDKGDTALLETVRDLF